MPPILGGVAGAAFRAPAIEYGTNVSTAPKRSAGRRLRGLAGLGMASSESYMFAVAIVPLLAEQDYASAAAMLAGLSPSEIAEVGRKTIALGADPDRAAKLVAFAGAEEVIEIVDSKPVIKPASRPWWMYALGALAVGGGGYAAYRKWGRR